jgi:hypothetical protein
MHLIIAISFILLKHKFLLNRRERDLKSRRTNYKKFEAELTKIPLSGTIVWKSFKQRRISDTRHFNARLKPELEFLKNLWGLGTE